MIDGDEGFDLVGDGCRTYVRAPVVPPIGFYIFMLICEGLELSMSVLSMMYLER
jgi:hypothetical protein